MFAVQSIFTKIHTSNLINSPIFKNICPYQLFLVFGAKAVGFLSKNFGWDSVELFFISLQLKGVLVSIFLIFRIGMSFDELDNFDDESYDDTSNFPSKVK